MRLLLGLMLLPALAVADGWQLVGEVPGPKPRWLIVDVAAGMEKGVRAGGPLPALARHVSCAPDGRHLAWLEREKTRWAVRVRAIGGAEAKSTALGFADLVPVNWSADGTHVVIARTFPKNRMLQINLLPPGSGGEPTRLTEERQGAWDAQYAKGTLLYRMSGVGLGQIGVRYGGKCKQLVTTRNGVGPAVLSGDGRWVAWSEALVSWRRGQLRPHRLHLTDLTGKAAQRVLLPGVGVSRLAWSPDGRWLAVGAGGALHLLAVHDADAKPIEVPLATLDPRLEKHGVYRLCWRPDSAALAMRTRPVARHGKPSLPPLAPTATREARIAAGDGTWILALRRPKPAPLTAAQKAAVEKWLPLLDGRRYRDRERATRELIALGPAVVPLLKAALSSASLEAETRLRQILAHRHDARFLPAVRPLGWRRAP